MSALWLVRHAKPLIAEGVVYGATDVAADDALTQDSAHRLAEVLPHGAGLHVSPLRRCRQLHAALRAWRPDLEAQASPDPRLAEMDFGTWEGWRWDNVPKAAMDAWTADFAQHRFGGVESVRMFMDRVASALDDTRRAAQPAAWITHLGVIRAVHLLEAGVHSVRCAAQWRGDPVGFGAWCRIDLKPGIPAGDPQAIPAH